MAVRALSQSKTNIRQFERPEESDDPTVLLAGQYASTAEMEAWHNIIQKLDYRQKFHLYKIWGTIGLRNSFIHGGVRNALTLMAVYAAGTEFLHDFFHHDSNIHWFLGLVGTEHAVGFIALSHLSEHFKEYLEEQDKPRFHAQEKKRLEIIRIFSRQSNPAWPRHVQWYHEQWSAVRGDAPCISEAVVAAGAKSNEAWATEMAAAGIQSAEAKKHLDKHA